MVSIERTEAAITTPNWPSNFPKVMTSQMFFDFAKWLYAMGQKPGPCPTLGVMFSLNCCFGFGIMGKQMTHNEVAMLSEFIGYALQDEGL